MDIFIIRHGQSTGNIVSHDVPDGELTELGRSQAERVAECLAEADIAHIVSSPLVRALSTAQPLARRLGLPVQVWKHAFEVRSKGFYRGPGVEALGQLYPEATFGAEMESAGWECPGNETWDMGVERAAQLWEQLKQAFAGQRVALFGHGGFNRALLYAVLGLSPDSPVRFEESNGSIIWLQLTGETVRVKYIGETRPLP